MKRKENKKRPEKGGQDKSKGEQQDFFGAISTEPRHKILGSDFGKHAAKKQQGKWQRLQRFFFNKKKLT